MKPILILSFAASLSACSVVGPDYAPPSADLAPRFTFAENSALREAAFDPWWKQLHDPVLNDLMAQGLSRNLSIRASRARIDEAAALLRAEGVSASQLSGTAALDLPRRRFDDTGQTTNLDGLSINGQFVFDLFGRATLSRRQAAANLQAATLEAGVVRLALQAELASALIEARFFQSAIASTQRTIANRREILSLTREIVRSGQLTRDQQVRAEAELAQARADLPSLRSGLHLSAVRAAALIDSPVGPVLRAIEGSRVVTSDVSGTVPAGVPADLLRNRPDVQAAERRLVAATAAIGVAEAVLYPELTLTGTLTAEDDSGSLVLGPRLSFPVLGRSRLRALRAAAEARAETAELTWREAVRDAVEDVELALVGRRTARDEITELRQVRSRFQTLANLSRETFQIGSLTLLELLDAEQEVQRAEIALAQARRDLALSTARLAVATGRGYAVVPDAPEAGGTEVLRVVSDQSY